MRVVHVSCRRLLSATANPLVPSSSPPLPLLAAAAAKVPRAVKPSSRSQIARDSGTCSTASPGAMSRRARTPRPLAGGEGVEEMPSRRAPESRSHDVNASLLSSVLLALVVTSLRSSRTCARKGPRGVGSGDNNGDHGVAGVAMQLSHRTTSGGAVAGVEHRIKTSRYGCTLWTKPPGARSDTKPHSIKIRGSQKLRSKF